MYLRVTHIKSTIPRHLTLLSPMWVSRVAVIAAGIAVVSAQSEATKNRFIVEFDPPVRLIHSYTHPGFDCTRPMLVLAPMHIIVSIAAFVPNNNNLEASVPTSTLLQRSSLAPRSPSRKTSTPTRLLLLLGQSSSAFGP